MKILLILLFQTAIAFFIVINGHAQQPFRPSSLFNVPALAPDSYHAVSLRYMGFKKSNNSILVKVRLPGDTIFYTIPGVLPTGDSFGFRLKAGNLSHSDTLYLIHRGGDNAVKLEEVLVLVFHKS